MSTIGIDLGGTNMRGVLLRSDDRQEGAVKHPVGDDRTPEPIIDRIVELVESLRAQAPPEDPVTAVGLGIAGWVRPGDGLVVKAPNLGWDSVPLRAFLEDRLSLPVLPMNDLSAIAYAEWRLGAARGADDVLVVFVGTGVGSGIILGGRLQEGAGGYAGEIGHIPVVFQGGRLCGCGNYGCLETVAGGVHLDARLREGIRQGKLQGALQAAGGKVEAINCSHAQQAADAGDPDALALFEEVATVLGGVLGGLANLLDPGVLVLGGGVMTGCGLLRQATIRHLRSKALAPVAQSLRIVQPDLGDPAGVVGAALRAREEPPS